MEEFYYMDYSIGEFSKITEISIYTLRYYESEHLIKPDRKSNIMKEKLKIKYDLVIMVRII